MILYGIQYYIPACVAAEEDSKVDATAHAFASTTACQEQLTADLDNSASFKIRGIALGGEVKARFSLSTAEEDSRFVATVSSLYRLYRLGIDKQLAYDNLVPALRNLPKAYNDNTRGKFFDFFQDYGLCYVSSIVCGGRLQLNASTLDKYVETTAEMEASVSMVADIFGIGGGQSQYHGKWSSANQSWLRESQLSWNAVGGRVGYLVVAPGTLDPELKPDIADQALAKWGESLSQDPSVVSFQVTSLADLLRNAGQIDQAVAVELATIDYIGGQILLISAPAGGSAKWSGHTADVSDGFLFVIIDRNNLSHYNTYTASQINDTVVEAALSPDKFCIFIMSDALPGPAVMDLLNKTSGRAGAKLDGFNDFATGGGSPMYTGKYTAITFMNSAGNRVGLDAVAFSTDSAVLPAPLWKRGDRWYSTGEPRG